jgi:hypothetical protein
MKKEEKLKFQKNKTYIVYDIYDKILRKLFIIDLDEISILAYDVDINQQARVLIEGFDIKLEVGYFYEYISIEYTSSYSWQDS